MFANIKTYIEEKGSEAGQASCLATDCSCLPFRFRLGVTMHKDHF